MTARRAFTLFELIVAIALSAVLLVLIGTAINLYLVRVDAGRQRVEEAQLARSVLAMIAADLRAAVVHRPQDTSAVAALAAARAASANASSSGGSTMNTGEFSGAASSEMSSSSPLTTGQTSPSAEATTELQQGVNGTLEELFVDVGRLPRMDELFAAVPSTSFGMANSVAANTPTERSDERTVRYFVREGEPIDPSSVATTSLAPEAQLRAGGLVRQEVDRAVRVWAERTGNQQTLDVGQRLMAPEVMHIQFRYFDGAEVAERWDMRERRSLPVAVEVRMWIVSPDAAQDQPAAAYNVAGLPADAREYQQTVYLPLAAASNSGGSVEPAASTSPSTSGSEP